MKTIFLNDVVKTHARSRASAGSIATNVTHRFAISGSITTNVTHFRFAISQATSTSNTITLVPRHYWSTNTITTPLTQPPLPSPRHYHHATATTIITTTTMIIGEKKRVFLIRKVVLYIIIHCTPLHHLAHLGHQSTIKSQSR